jgi:hypothetical protein
VRFVVFVGFVGGDAGRDCHKRKHWREGEGDAGGGGVPSSVGFGFVVLRY